MHPRSVLLLGVAVFGTANISVAQTVNTGGTGATAGGTSQQPQLAAIQAAPIIAPPSEVQTTTSGAVNPSNFLAPTYANPYYQGRAGALPTDPAGGFGTPLYNSTGSATGRGGAGTSTTTGFGAGGRGATTGVSLGTGATATGAGGARGTTGLGGNTGGQFGGTTGGQFGRTSTGSGNTGTGNSAFTGGVIVPLVQPIAYRAVLKFKGPPPKPAGVMQTELTRMLVGSSFVPSAANVQVLTSGSEVVLRGAVADADEARTIEGMIRLTPGVTAVRNELVVR